MSEWELTGDEIAKAKVEAQRKGDSRNEEHYIAKAAQRKLVEWLHEPCHKHNAGLLRLGCPECWRNLRKGVGI